MFLFNLFESRKTAVQSRKSYDLKKIKVKAKK